MNRASLICSIILRYQTRYSPAVVSYGLDSLDGAAPLGCNCDPPRTYLVVGNFTELMTLVSDGYRKRQMYLVVLSSSATRAVVDHGERLQPFATRLGYSRFILQTDDTFDGIKDRLPEFFHCLMILVSRDRVDAAADFVQCSQRRLVTQLDEVENFSNTTTLVCHRRCSTRLAKREDDAYVEQFRRHLKLTAVRTASIDPKASMTVRTKKQIELLSTRKAEIALLPLFAKYERLNVMTYSMPLIFFDYELISWRQRQQTMSATGLIKMFDVWSWVATISYIGVQVLLMAFVLRSPLEAFTLVVAAFLGQSVSVRNGFLWKLNFSFLLIAGFVIGATICNTLKAYLNVQIPIKLNTADDLRWAFKKKLVSHVCIGRYENLANSMKLEKLDGFMGFVRDAKTFGALLETDTVKECVEFVLKSRKHTAVIIRPKAFLQTTYERANIYLGESDGTQQMLAQSTAPWAPNREALDSFLLMTLETGVFFEYRLLIIMRNTPFKMAVENPDPLFLNDLMAPFGLLVTGSALATQIFIAKKIIDFVTNARWKRAQLEGRKFSIQEVRNR